ncbi:MAG TPA: aminodeoxychorismate/anthranilate synthase component II [Bacteroidetes bacterium]|nr:aminodeoxychorismate/anthranilate synthase component II [Bacteroidota bacterium]
MLLLDNYDSFTYNLADYLFRSGAEVDVLRNDQFSLEALQIERFAGVMISPGPSTPENAGLLMPFLEKYADQIPVLGVCLGFQALGILYGASLTAGREPVHGKSSEINCITHAMYEGIPLRHRVGRYHSLCLDNMPDCLELTASTADAVPMAFAHRSLPIWGVQYHPEAVYTEFGLRFIQNWVNSLKS